jgi:hypothetical protein
LDVNANDIIHRLHLRSLYLTDALYSGRVSPVDWGLGIQRAIRSAGAVLAVSRNRSGTMSPEDRARLDTIIMLASSQLAELTAFSNDARPARGLHLAVSRIFEGILADLGPVPVAGGPS